MKPRHREFYRRLADLLEEFDVDLNATDDEEPYGLQSPLIQVEFDAPYRSDEFTYINAEAAREIAEEEA